MANSESKVQKALVNAINGEFGDGVYLRKIHQSLCSHGGIPDLLGSLNGKFFAIEVKTSTGKTTKLQDRELRFIDQSGALALVCKGIEDIERILYELRIYWQTTV